jgi:predicted negative regulator of RcsB-dependent stress response
MSVYMTEAEQLAAIKKWWQRYSNIITVVLSLVLLAASGYKYWTWHQEKVTQQASGAYEHLMLALSNQDNKGIRAYANQLLNDYGQTVYADAAHMMLAKLYAGRGKYAQALKELDYVATHSKMAPVENAIPRCHTSRPD